MRALLVMVVLAWSATLSPTLSAQVGGERGGNTGKPSILEPRPLTEQEDLRRRTAVVEAILKARDAVINVYVKVGDRLPSNLPFARKSTFTLRGSGSGVIIDSSGLAITNWHVVESATEESGEQKLDHRIEITLNDDTRYDARVLSTDQDNDLALLRIEIPAGEELHAVEIGDSDGLLLGETVIAIGNPFGDANTVTVGILSAVNRDVTVAGTDGPHAFKNLLQTDAALNPGNSGGALIDLNGKLIGINNASSSEMKGISFAIPVSTVRTVFKDSLVSVDKLRGVFVGLIVRDEELGVMVVEVEPHSPAALEGLQVGDRLLEVGGAPAGTSLDFHRAMLQASAEVELPLVIERDGKELEFNPRPLANTVYAVLRRTGIELEEVLFREEPDTITTASIELLRASSGNPTAMPNQFMESSLRVIRIRPDSPGHAAGIEAGDFLLGIEIAIKGSGFDELRTETYERLDRISESFAELARDRDATHRCWLLRGGKIIQRSLKILKLP